MVTIEGFPNVVSPCARVGLGVVAPDVLIVEEAEVEGVNARNLFDALINCKVEDQLSYPMRGTIQLTLIAFDHFAFALKFSFKLLDRSCSPATPSDSH